VKTALVALIPIAFGCSDSMEPSLDNEANDTGVVSEPGPDDRALKRYIVVFKSDVQDPSGAASGLALSQKGTLHHVYESAIRGCSVTLPDGAVEALLKDPRVASIEPDRPVQIFDPPAAAQVSSPSWGLDRVDQTDLPLDNSFSFEGTGAGVNIYVIDSGIELSHADFGGRAQYVHNWYNNGNFHHDGQEDADDCYGHGTPVAAVAAGSEYGIAKEATIWALRVLDCNGIGHVSHAMAAVDWITRFGELPGVVNMSLGYADSPHLREAVENSIAAGFVYVVASANSMVPMDACTVSPANAPSAITVGATDALDDEAYWSNYGTCVDLLAPGTAILSASHLGGHATVTRSGTSMAAPHVAGTIALYLEAYPDATPADVAEMIAVQATPGRIGLHSFSQGGGTPNLLLYSALPPNQPPTARIRPVCSRTLLLCTFSGRLSVDTDGSIASYLWDFGDGGTASGRSAAHEYATEGVYTVTLTVIDDDGASDVTTVDIEVDTDGGWGVTGGSHHYRPQN
jgi:subtilisin family serine protease